MPKTGNYCKRPERDQKEMKELKMYGLRSMNHHLEHLKPAHALGLVAVFMFVSMPAIAAVTKTAEMDWGSMAMQLMGGLALFLFGMEQMSDALKAVAGERMKTILAALTSNRIVGAITGAFVTAIIQSSSVTTVLVVGFITAGLMSLSQSIGIIMGANIGTTITAQIVAFKITKAALLMVAIGFSMLFFSKQERTKQYGAMLMGLGMVFYGMSVMSGAMKPLRSFQPFLDLMITMENPLIGILVAAAFTGLVQSSSATTGIVIVMAGQGFITLPAGIALAFGANIGTCVTALLASIGKPCEAIRAAAVHVLFNVFGVILWLGFIDYLAEVVTMISPVDPNLTGMDKLAAETPRQIANAHTIFNVANTIIFLGFTTQFARLVEWLVPDKPLDETLITQTKYLDDELLATPSLALDRVRFELDHMGQRVKDMYTPIMEAILDGDKEKLKTIHMADDEVDILYGQIVNYLGKISQTTLTGEQTHEFANLMTAVNDMEHLGDLIETDMIDLGNKRVKEDIHVSKETREVLVEIHQMTLKTFEQVLWAIKSQDQRAAQEVVAMKREIYNLIETAELHEAQRLIANEPDRLVHYGLEMEIIEKIKRVYYLSRRIAKMMLPHEIAVKQEN